jgi:superfamily II DNA helicase RecQ
MCCQLDEKNIKYSQWTAGGSQVRSNTCIILVTADAAASPYFLTFLHKIFHAKKLVRIVLDEVQVILLVYHYHPLLCFLHLLRELAVQLLLLTAMMPGAVMAELLQNLQILPATTKLICASTIWPNITYSHFKIDSRNTDMLTFTDVNGRSQNIVMFIVNHSGNIQVGDHILVYCLTRDNAEMLAKRLGCDFYHSKLDEADQNCIYNQWMSDQGSCILTATSCLGTGMDYPAVCMVVHWKLPRNLLDKEQESGRAGQDGKEACSVVFWDPSDKGWSLAPGQSTLGVEEQKQWACMDQCLWIIPGAFMDGCGDTCFQLGTVKLCDWCEAAIPKQVSLSEHFTITIDLVPCQAMVANSTQRMKDIQTALTEMQQEAPVVPDTLKWKQVSSPIAGPSTTMEISASHAVCKSNRTAVAQAKAVRNQAQTKALLVMIKDAIGMHDKCSSCWFMGMTHNHGLDANLIAGNAVYHRNLEFTTIFLQKIPAPIVTSCGLSLLLYGICQLTRMRSFNT